MSKIVVLVGSPRRNGNTEKLADALIKGAEAAGNTVQKFSVADAKVNGCLACEYCIRNEGKCVQKDGMQPIYDALYASDTVVFATPVYYFGMSAQIKAIIDRLYASIARPLPITSAALLVALGGDVQTDGADTLAHYRTITKYLGWQDKGSLLVGGVMEKNDIDGNAALADAEAMGRGM